MRREYQVNERIIDKGIELWKNILKNPKFDNGDDSATGGVAMAMAMLLPNNTNDENLALFGKYLKEYLMGQKYPPYLSTDYGPDMNLGEAAEKAGLKLEFPWKTSMHISDRYIGLSYGYAAETVYYYPLPDGKWLITKLYGSDIDKVIDYVLGGKPEFQIEPRQT